MDDERKKLLKLELKFFNSIFADERLVNGIYALNIYITNYSFELTTNCMCVKDGEVQTFEYHTSEYLFVYIYLFNSFDYMMIDYDEIFGVVVVSHLEQDLEVSG